MTDEVRGRFGVVAPEAVAYLRAIREAFWRAPMEEWAEAKLADVLSTECERYGVAPGQIEIPSNLPRAE